MRDIGTRLIAVAYLIADELTNLGRADESEPDSGPNRALIENFATPRAGICGWNPEFPAVVVPMKDTKLWFFTKGFDFMNPAVGCTAQEFINAEMVRREMHLTGLKAVAKDAKDDKRVLAEMDLLNYQQIYCDKAGNLIKLTLDNSYWVDSGHQRLEKVFVPARLLWMQKKAAVAASNASAAAAAKAAGEKFEPVELPPFEVTIPCLERVYANIEEAVEAQTDGNCAKDFSTKLGFRDLVKSARRQIGNGPVPKKSEGDFRGGGGDLQRGAYHAALLDWQFGGGFGIYEGLMAPATLTIEGTDKTKPNPDHIPFDAVSVKNKFDPLRNATVVNRLCNRTALAEYQNRYGIGSAEYKQKGDDWKGKKSSKIEDAVFRTKAGAWLKEEFKAWVPTLYVNRPGVPATITEDPDKTPKPDANKAMEVIKALTGSTNIPEFAKELLIDVQKGNMETDAINALSGVKGAALNLVARLKAEHKFLQALADADVLMDGSPELFEELVDNFCTALQDAKAKASAPAVEEPAAETKKAPKGHKTPKGHSKAAASK